MEQFNNKLHHGNTLEYWKNNAEEDYSLVPISVLKYITVLEEALKDSLNREDIKIFLDTLHFHGYIDHDITKLNDLLNYL